MNAGADVVSWLQDGVRTRNLNGSVVDDGAIAPYTVRWTVISEPDDPDSPDAIIADSTAENTSVTMSAVGQYVLQLDAFDGEYTASDTVTIDAYPDSCEATKALPDYEPLVGDLNGDCKVNDLDITVTKGTLRHEYPLYIHAPEGAEFVASGGLGYVPMTFGGLPDHRGYRLQRYVDEAWVEVDQSVHGRDFWQTDYENRTGTWEITYTVSQDHPGDDRIPTAYRFSRNME